MTFDDGLDELIIGLDEHERPFPVRKLDAHRTSLRHAAVSVFLFDGSHLLVQQRARGKYHAPALWANTACSHPRWGEGAEACVERTLLRELGLEAATTPFETVEYQASVGSLYEHEVVRCFRGDIGPNAAGAHLDGNEVQAIAWMTLTDIRADIARQPQVYAPWFRIYVKRGVVDRALVAKSD